MLLLFSGVSLAVFTEKNQPMGGLPAIFWSIFVDTFRLQGSPTLRRKNHRKLRVFPFCWWWFRNPAKITSWNGKWFPRLPFLKGLGLGFGDVPVTSCPGAVGGNQDEDRSPCAEEVPGGVVWFWGRWGWGGYPTSRAQLVHGAAVRGSYMWGKR